MFMATCNVKPTRGGQKAHRESLHLLLYSQRWIHPTAMMDLPTGWGKAKHKDKKSGKRISYYFNKNGLASSRVPPPPQYYNDEASLHEDGGFNSEPDVDRRSTNSCTQ